MVGYINPVRLSHSYITLEDRGERVRLRRSLFWDVPEKEIDLQRNKRLVIERVFSRGDIEELNQILKYYSAPEIKKEVIRIGTFDKKTLNFICLLYNIEPEDFKCYTEKQ